MHNNKYSIKQIDPVVKAIWRVSDRFYDTEEEAFSSTLKQNRPPLFSVSTAPWYFSATVLILESPVPAGGTGLPEQVFSKISI